MKLTKEPTPYIMVSAMTNSEWDSCDFILLRLSPEYINTLQARVMAVNKVKEENNFYNISFWDSPDGWYQACYLVGEDMDEEEREIDVPQDWSFVELEEKELEEIVSPEQRIDAECMRIHAGGMAQFVGYGKHTSEEFYTAEFPLSQIVMTYAHKMEELSPR